MPQRELLEVLRCPEDHSVLAPASDAVASKINAAIRQRQVFNRAGKRLEQEIDGGLMRADGTLLYPIVDGIPVLLKDEAISIADCGMSIAD